MIPTTCQLVNNAISRQLLINASTINEVLSKKNVVFKFIQTTELFTPMQLPPFSLTELQDRMVYSQTSMVPRTKALQNNTLDIMFVEKSAEYCGGTYGTENVYTLRIAKELLNTKDIAVTAFTDIEGAVDKICLKSLELALERRRFNPLVLRLDGQYVQKQGDTYSESQNLVTWLAGNVHSSVSFHLLYNYTL